MNDLSRRFLPPSDEPETPVRARARASGPFGVLDIGTTKIVCIIGRVESDGSTRVLGFGWQRGRGMRGGPSSISRKPSARSALPSDRPRTRPIRG